MSVKQLVANDPWTVVQEGFDAEQHRVFESLFSLGNGHLGGRGNHEERYSGDTLRGNYLAGIYYPDPTRVGWWKNGYPDYFAKVLNAPDWKALDITVDGEPLDLATATITEYRRILHLKTAELERHVRATLPNGRTVAIDTVRFVSMTRRHLAALRYRITPLDGPATITIESQVDGDVVNEDSNYDEGFWDDVDADAFGGRTTIVTRTRQTEFLVATAADVLIGVGGEPVEVAAERWTPRTADRFAAAATTLDVDAHDTVEIVKFGASFTSRTRPEATLEELTEAAHGELDAALPVGFDLLQAEHRAAWARKWEISDVVIGGDAAAQQGIRFGIFGLHSTFTGDDPDLNIGPKGFTGREVRRGHLLGHRSVLSAVLPRHVGARGRQEPPPLPTSSAGQGDRERREARLHRRCCAVSDGDDQRRGMPQRVGDHLRGDPPQRRDRVRDLRLHPLHR